MRESPDFSTHCHGIPCGIVIDTYLVVPPWRGHPADCPSDLDFHGYTELEYHIIDRKGYWAHWLESILTVLDRIQLENEIHQQHARPFND